jgi:hypothetical protein
MKRRSAGGVGLTVLTWILAVLFFLPVAWMLLTSLH